VIGAAALLLSNCTETPLADGEAKSVTVASTDSPPVTDCLESVIDCTGFVTTTLIEVCTGATRDNVRRLPWSAIRVKPTPVSAVGAT
jgi:hypothetical protein